MDAYSPVTDDYDPWDNAFTGKIKIIRVKHKEAPAAHDEPKGGGLAQIAAIGGRRGERVQASPFGLFE